MKSILFILTIILIVLILYATSVYDLHWMFFLILPIAYVLYPGENNTNAIGGEPSYILPFSRLNPNYIESNEFKLFVNNPQKISNLHNFLQTHSSDVLKFVVNKYGSGDIMVLNEAMCESVYLNRLKTSKESRDKMMKYQDDEYFADVKKMIESEEQILEERRKNTEKEFAKYNKKNGKIIQPARVSSNSQTHATSIMVDFDNRQIIYIDPHFQDTANDSYNCFLDMRSQIIKNNPEIEEFWYGNLSDLVNFRSYCPVFQGSFSEQGLCPFWNIYMLSIFCLNDIIKFDDIIDHHFRNVKWTQRNLQEFIFTIYKKFEKNIENIQHSELYSITGNVTPESTKGKYDCEQHGWLWSNITKTCYDDEDDKFFDELDHVNNKPDCDSINGYWDSEEKKCYMSEKSSTRSKCYDSGKYTYFSECISEEDLLSKLNAELKEIDDNMPQEYHDDFKQNIYDGLISEHIPEHVIGKLNWGSYSPV